MVTGRMKKIFLYTLQLAETPGTTSNHPCLSELADRKAWKHKTSPVSYDLTLKTLAYLDHRSFCCYFFKMLFIQQAFLINVFFEISSLSFLDERVALL